MCANSHYKKKKKRQVHDLGAGTALGDVGAFFVRVAIAQGEQVALPSLPWK